MYRSSFFIEGKALFGSFPSQEDVNELEREGVRFFIDLTQKTEEALVPYVTKYTYMNYPVYDRHIPVNHATFAALIIKISNIIRGLKNEEKIYIHCKGGHGRAGILVSSILVFHEKVNTSEALYLTSKFHARRENLHKKWLKHGSPHGLYQKIFVHNFFKDLRYCCKNYFSDFCDNSPHKVTLPDYGTFNTAKDAIDFLKIKLPLTSTEKCIEMVLTCKLAQHADILEKLCNTGLRNLILHSKDAYYGNAYNDSGKNIHGKVLMRLREIYLEKIEI